MKIGERVVIGFDCGTVTGVDEKGEILTVELDNGPVFSRPAYVRPVDDTDCQEVV